MAFDKDLDIKKINDDMADIAATAQDLADNANVNSEELAAALQDLSNLVAPAIDFTQKVSAALNAVRALLPVPTPAPEPLPVPDGGGATGGDGSDTSGTASA